jgi:hypothetical protein
MTRDMDLIREILFAVESRTDTLPKEVTVGGHDKETVIRHVQMLVEAGYLRGKQHPSGSSHYPVITINDLTWEGHELISAVRNKDIWNEIKQRFGAELPKMPIVILKEIGTALVRQRATSQTG